MILIYVLCVKKLVAKAHNTKSDLHFILNRNELKWQHKLIMKGMKIIGTKMEHFVFLDSVSSLK